jgi:hypothetical protein
MVLRKLNRAALIKTPYLFWNACIDLVAMEQYQNLDNVQRVAHLTFWYDTEVQNGGHLQYFENRQLAYLKETIGALRVLGAIAQSKVLEAASDVWNTKPRAKIESVEEYVATALALEFNDFDNAFHKCKPAINTTLLSCYFDQNKDHFVNFE